MLSLINDSDFSPFKLSVSNLPIEWTTFLENRKFNWSILFSVIRSQRRHFDVFKQLHNAVISVDNRNIEYAEHNYLYYYHLYHSSHIIKRLWSDLKESFLTSSRSFIRPVFLMEISTLSRKFLYKRTFEDIVSLALDSYFIDLLIGLKFRNLGPEIFPFGNGSKQTTLSRPANIFQRKPKYLES